MHTLLYVIYIFLDIDTLLFFTTFCLLIKFHFCYSDYVEGKRQLLVDLQQNPLISCNNLYSLCITNEFQYLTL